MNEANENQIGGHDKPIKDDNVSKQSEIHTNHESYIALKIKILSAGRLREKRSQFAYYLSRKQIMPPIQLDKHNTWATDMARC